MGLDPRRTRVELHAPKLPITTPCWPNITMKLSPGGNVEHLGRASPTPALEITSELGKFILSYHQLPFTQIVLPPPRMTSSLPQCNSILVLREGSQGHCTQSSLFARLPLALSHKARICLVKFQESGKNGNPVFKFLYQLGSILEKVFKKASIIKLNQQIN